MAEAVKPKCHLLLQAYYGNPATGRLKPCQDSAPEEKQPTTLGGPHLEKINANLHRMPKVTVLGIPALITPHKISRDTIHLGLFCYELKGDGNALEYPIIVAKEVCKR